MNKQQLIERLRAMGFSEKILEAFSAVKREDFIPEELQRDTYEDTALPIGHGQTISQPYTIAVMLSELDLNEGQKVLEVGSGSGYVLALISKIIGKKNSSKHSKSEARVFGLEVIKKLAKKSKEALENYRHIKVYNKNGSGGLPEEAPFDRILVSAAVREIPKKLLSQLKEKGILVAPKGPVFEQNIVVIQRQGDKFITKTEIPGFVFVPFVGE